MSQNVIDAKTRIDLIIRKARVDFYKPIQIAEVLHRSRTHGDVDPLDKTTYQNPSLRWCNDVTRQLLGKVSTFKAEFPQVAGVVEFFQQRGYLNEDTPGLWQVASIAE